MNDARVGKAFVQNFRILLKNLLKKLDADSHCHGLFV